MLMVIIVVGLDIIASIGSMGPIIGKVTKKSVTAITPRERFSHPDHGVSG